MGWLGYFIMAIILKIIRYLDLKAVQARVELVHVSYEPGWAFFQVLRMVFLL